MKIRKLGDFNYYLTSNENPLLVIREQKIGRKDIYAWNFTCASFIHEVKNKVQVKIHRFGFIDKFNGIIIKTVTLFKRKLNAKLIEE